MVAIQKRARTLPSDVFQMTCLFGDEQMTTVENASRNQRQVDKIYTVVNADPILQNHSASLQVSIEDTGVTLRGELPDSLAKSALFLAVRQAGVLDQISDYIRISGSIVKSA
jgi:hypothetical protein